MDQWIDRWMNVSWILFPMVSLHVLAAVVLDDLQIFDARKEFQKLRA